VAVGFLAAYSIDQQTDAPETFRDDLLNGVWQDFIHELNPTMHHARALPARSRVLFDTMTLEPYMGLVTTCESAGWFRGLGGKKRLRKLKSSAYYCSIAGWTLHNVVTSVIERVGGHEAPDLTDYFPGISEAVLARSASDAVIRSGASRNDL